MSGHDPEFEDFLARRKPLFRGDADDGLEPPPELDRIVLRQAREAIQPDKPLRMLGMPRWGAPVAIAATLVLGLSVVFKASLPVDQKIPRVTVENATQRFDPMAEQMAPPPPPPPAPASDASAAEGAVVIELAPSAAVRRDVASAPAVTSPTLDTTPWRRDAASWRAEIERLRSSGDVARADAEQAEFNRQQRAYAVSPDR
jgi:hypothetical protein